MVTVVILYNIQLITFIIQVDNNKVKMLTRVLLYPTLAVALQIVGLRRKNNIPLSPFLGAQSYVLFDSI